MERGPVALFGAIVAVGLGPALWLGAQFGNVSVAPERPPPVVGEQQVDTGKAPGEAGAAPEEPAVLKPEPKLKSGYVPLSSIPSVRPSTRAPADAEPDEPDAITTSTTPAPVEPTPSSAPTTPQTEATTGPTSPVPSNGNDDPAEDGPAPGGSGANSDPGENTAA